MNDIQTYEKLVKRKADAKLIVAKILLIILYITVALIGFSLVITFKDVAAPLLLIVIAFDALLIFIFWRFTNVEYEYSIVGDEFSLSKIYGKSNRKDIFECELSRAKTIAPYRDEHKENADLCRPDKTFIAISSKDCENIWYAIFEDESEKIFLVYFEADDSALKLIRRANPRATVRLKPTEKPNV